VRVKPVNPQLLLEQMLNCCSCIWPTTAHVLVLQRSSAVRASELLLLHLNCCSCIWKGVRKGSTAGPAATAAPPTRAPGTQAEKEKTGRSGGAAMTTAVVASGVTVRVCVCNSDARVSVVGLFLLRVFTRLAVHTCFYGYESSSSLSIRVLV
jgi:hypothetical protein